MDFEAMQNKLASLHLDTRTTWVAGGTYNKEAINEGYKEVYDMAIQDRSVQEIMKTDKTLLTITDKVGTMPSDYKQPVKLYFKSSGVTDEIDKEIFPYRFIRDAGTNKIIFDEQPTVPVYIEYIKKIDDLVDNTDVSVLPSEFDSDIVRFAMVEYHRKQRDWAEVSNELQYAEGKFGNTIDNFWLE